MKASRYTRRAAWALRAIHHEQVLMWELFWRVGRASAGPPRPRLTGSCLPAPDEAGRERGYDR